MLTNFKTYVTEGGQFGHLANIWEIGTLTASQLIKVIHNSVKLNFGFTDLKLDSVALSFTVRADGKVVGSRNKGQSKNFGETGLDIPSMAAKFKGHQLEFAYTWTLKNLQTAINRLSAAQKKKIFNDGHNWMAVEVLGWGANNIIDYGGVKELILLGTVEYNADGVAIGHINKEHGRILDGMLRQNSAEQQSKFVIRNVTKATFNDIKDADKLKSSLEAEVKTIMRGAKTINDLKINHLRKILIKKTKDTDLINTLTARWIHQDKSTGISSLYKQYPADASWIKSMDANIGATIKDIILPLEKVYLKLGAEVISALNVFKSADPEKTANKLRKDFMRAAETIKASGDNKLISKLALELGRLEAAGGVEAIAPEEGITFFLDHGKDRTLVKLTGTFAPVNQIIGLLYSISGRG